MALCFIFFAFVLARSSLLYLHCVLGVCCIVLLSVSTATIDSVERVVSKMCQVGC